MYYKNFAKVYDKFMKHCNYDEWVEVVEEFIKESGVDCKKILDLGCGTGEVLTRLKDKYECSGLDLSEGMLTIANKKLKNKGVKLFLGDMREFETYEKYDVIISLFDTVNHLTTQEDLNETLQCVKTHLNDGGIYIFDIVSREFMVEMFPGGTYYDDRGDMTIIWEHFQEEELDVVEAVFFIKNKQGTYEKLKEVYEKKIFTKMEINESLNNLNFTLLRNSKDVRIAGDRQFYVVRKG